MSVTTRTTHATIKITKQSQRNHCIVSLDNALRFAYKFCRCRLYICPKLSKTT